LFEISALINHFQVEQICVRQRAALSFYSHKYKSEQSIVNKDTVKIIVDEDIKFAIERQLPYLTLGSRNCIKNPGDLLMVLVDVWIVTY
jgi:hypothetical protein